MFDNSRFMTARIAMEIQLETQLYLWSLIDQLKDSGQVMDYLQVFKLSPAISEQKSLQEIVHTQEHPQYQNICKINASKIIQASIFVIDDGNHSTMMFSGEY